MASLHCLGQHYQNEVQNEFIGHVTQLAPAMSSYDADNVVNGTIAFLV